MRFAPGVESSSRTSERRPSHPPPAPSQVPPLANPSGAPGQDGTLKGMAWLGEVLATDHRADISRV